ncbi:hypothetical protein [Phenylobacterium sp.]|uniref:hypothetical protein n=1 Tax=Phenylobacterium sp. TaxID=1871053 RepID=UPI00301CD4F2
MRGWLLDINVVSEPMRARPDARVLDWLRAAPPSRTYLSVLTLAEIDQGIELLALQDPRRDRVIRYRDEVGAWFSGRILPLDNEAVRLWGRMAGRYRKAFGGKAPAVDAC